MISDEWCHSTRTFLVLFSICAFQFVVPVLRCVGDCSIVGIETEIGVLTL